MYVYPSIERTEVGGSVVAIENPNSMTERYTQHHVERKVYLNHPINADAAITYFKSMTVVDRKANVNTYAINFRFLTTNWEVDGAYQLSWTYTNQQDRDTDFQILKEKLGTNNGHI